MKYHGDLEVQIFCRETGRYARWSWVPPIAAIAREIAAGAPWRIAKLDRPLDPSLLDHYREYSYIGDNQGKS